MVTETLNNVFARRALTTKQTPYSGRGIASPKAARNDMFI